MEKTGERILSALGYPEESIACVGFVDDETICKMHLRWFDDPSVTNVVSLEYKKNDRQPGLLGEVYVSVEAAAREARSAGWSTQYRLAWLMMHGLLHICGFEHVNVAEEEVRRMEDWEDRLDKAILRPLWGAP